MNKRPNSQRDRPRPQSRRHRLALTFSPFAWAKLIYLRDRGDTEVGGFGIATGNDPLHVTDIELVEQQCSFASVEFEDNAVADFVDRQVDSGLTLAQCLRIWVHRHPGDSANPSLTDEATFSRVFGRCDWAVMFILAQESETYARLRFNVGPGGEMVIPVEVDFSDEFKGSDWDAWEAEYEANVNPCVQPQTVSPRERILDYSADLDETEFRELWLEEWAEYASQFEGEVAHDCESE